MDASRGREHQSLVRTHRTGVEIARRWSATSGAAVFLYPHQPFSRCNLRAGASPGLRLVAFAAATFSLTIDRTAEPKNV
jgi:hypothetical protein